MTTSKPMSMPKLMLTIVTGGVVLGALGGQLTSPVMKFAEEPDWRSRYESRFSETPQQFVETGPEDLSPATWFGPVYAEPAVFAPQYTAIPEYSPTTDSESYAAHDASDPYVTPEVDQASVAAASTAADLTEASAANVQRSEALQSGAMSDAASSAVTPPDLDLADKAS
jgi:hypothetical protein